MYLSYAAWITGLYKHSLGIKILGWVITWDTLGLIHSLYQNVWSQRTHLEIIPLPLLGSGIIAL